jgi:hypothetical protein
LIYHYRLTVTRETPNKGRQFYGCSKPISAPDRCNFFLWADDQPVATGHQAQFNNRSNTQNNNRPMNNSYRARPGNSKFIFKFIILDNLHKLFMFVDQSNSGQRKCGLCKQTGKLEKFRSIFY